MLKNDMKNEELQNDELQGTSGASDTCTDVVIGLAVGIITAPLAIIPAVVSAAKK